MTDRSANAGFTPFEVVTDPNTDPTLLQVVAELRKLGSDDPLRFHLLRATEAILSRANRSSGKILLASGSQYTVDLVDRFAALLSVGYLQEVADLDLLCGLVQPGATIVDVGANFGLYAIEMGRLAGSAGTVFAFEPGPSAFALLQSNAAVNGLAGRVHCIKSAVAAESGVRTFHVAESSAFSGLSDTGRSLIRERIDVQCVALDEFEALAGRTVDLMKIDVEGAEFEVLTGASALIDRSPHLIVQFEATRKNLDASGLKRLMLWMQQQRQSGYVVRVGAAEASPGSVLEATDQLDSCRSGNLYLMRSGGDAERRFLEMIAAVRAERERDHAATVDLRALLCAISDRLSSELRHWRQTLEGSIAPLRKDIESRSEALKVHEAKTAEIKIEVADRGRSLKLAEQMIRDLQTELSDRGEALNFTQARIATLNAKYAARGAVLETEHSRRARAERDLAAERGFTAKLSQESADRAQVIKECEVVIETLRTEMQQLELALAASRSDVVRLEAELSQHRSALEESSGTLAALREGKVRAEERLTASERRNAELREQLEAEASAHSTEVARVRAEIGWLVDQLKSQGRGLKGPDRPV